jgi:hypothetical protein
MKRESDLIPDTVYHFVKQVASLIEKLIDAALMKLSDPAGTDNEYENFFN